MATETFRIIYCSRNLIDPDSRDASVAQILATARRNNSRAGVTGALLYNDGMFVQALEGEFEAVQAIFEHIQADERHADVVVLQAETVEAPMFAEWAMAFAEPQDKTAADRILSKAIAKPEDGQYHLVLDLLDRVVRYEEEWSDVTV